MFASSCNRVDIVRELLLRGAQPNARNNDGSTALIEACCLAHSGKQTILLFLFCNLASGDTSHRLRLAAAAAELLNHGAHVDARNKFGYTALMSAASRGYPVIVALLLTHTPNIQLQVHLQQR